jgi:hypothetical protein
MSFIKIVKSSLIIALLLAVSLSSFYAGRKMSPRILTFNPSTGQWAPLVEKDGVKIFVASPGGDDIEPGAVIAHTKDGKKVLIVPPSMLREKAQPEKYSGSSSLKTTQLRK